MSHSSVLEVNNLQVAYDRKTVLKDLSFIIPEGVCAGIIGPNGAGKSTLIKVLLDLLPKQSGEIYFWQKDFELNRNRIAYIPQAMTFDHYFPATVLDVVEMALYPLKKWWQPLGKDLKNRALEALISVQMQDLLKSSIHHLSGGQKQRVFIARALAQNADFYLMDEPFTGVDQVTENIMKHLFIQMQKDKKTLLMVHHDLSTAKELFDWVIILNKELIGFGETQKVFNQETLEKAYHVPFKL